MTIAYAGVEFFSGLLNFSEGVEFSHALAT
jgi:hypothetical protein